MSGLLCSGKAANLEEYKKLVKKRMCRMVVIFFIGVLTLAVSLWAEGNEKVKIESYMLGVYCGTGTGMAIASLILFLKNFFNLHNETKLNAERIQNSDERNLELNQKAFQVAGLVMVGCLYVVGLIGGLFYPILVHVLLGMISVFVLIYLITYKIYERKM